jgi:hypothetical protein
MGRPRKNSKSIAIEPEDISQDIEDRESLEATDPDEVGADMPNKTQAARAAIDEGYEKPSEAVAWIRSTYGMDLGAQHFSAIKSQLKKKDEKGSKRHAAPKPGRGSKAVAAGPAVSPSSSEPEPAGGDDLLEALGAIKPLIAQFGAEKVKKMVDLLG